MQQDNYNIKDVLLNDDEELKTTNVKKVLVAIAALVILFLIILIIMKIINSGNIETDEPLVMPDTTTQIEKPQQSAADTVNIKPVTIKQPISKHEEIKKQLEQNDSENLSERSNQPQQTITVINSNESTGVKVVNSTKEEISPKKDIIEKTPDVKKEIKESKNTQIPEPAVKKAAEKVVAKKDTEKPKKETIDLIQSAPKSINKTQNNNKIYIQVFASKSYKNDDPKLTKIKKLGYNIVLHDSEVKGSKYTKVLIGPFNQEQANKALSDIRKNVNPEAFIFKQ